ncbi:MAG: hypothetical protein ACPGUV_12490, partial [Polyangiales bacterium]
MSGLDPDEAEAVFEAYIDRRIGLAAAAPVHAAAPALSADVTVRTPRPSFVRLATDDAVSDVSPSSDEELELDADLDVEWLTGSWGDEALPRAAPLRSSTDGLTQCIEVEVPADAGAKAAQAPAPPRGSQVVLLTRRKPCPIDAELAAVEAPSSHATTMPPSAPGPHTQRVQAAKVVPHSRCLAPPAEPLPERSLDGLMPAGQLARLLEEMTVL